MHLSDRSMADGLEDILKFAIEKQNNLLTIIKGIVSVGFMHPASKQ